MPTLAGSVLLYLGLFWAWLSLGLETCTGGESESLHLGGLETAVFYAIGIGLLIARPPRMTGWVLLLPALAGTIYQAWLSISAFRAYWFSGIPMCQWQLGAPYGYDGREPPITIWWLAMSVLCILGIGYAWARASRSTEKAGA
jgi:hypothetical protein